MTRLARILRRRTRIRRAFQTLTTGAPDASAGHQERVRLLREKIAPLTLRVGPEPRRVNLLIPTIDLRYVFGGYIAKLNLARRLAEAGLRVRIVVVDWCDWRPGAWRRELEAFAGLGGLLDLVELAPAFDRRQALDVSDDDAFLATTWWTAHLAHTAGRELNRDRFVYLIQEYEPYTFPMGAFAALAAQSYTFPHYALFSTELLREHFRRNSIGVFAAGPEAGDRMSLSFENAITTTGQVQTADIAGRTPKRLLFYARPEPHAARNMFELGLLALSDAVSQGVFRGRWEFHGIGSVGRAERIPLGHNWLQMAPRRPQDDYGEHLRMHDLGLSLMFTPHPSLVPIEMAAAGMVVVTNTFANKTAERLEAISSNLIGVEPTLEDVRQGLETAVRRVQDCEARARGARVRWSTSWDASLNEDLLDRVSGFLEPSLRTTPATREAAS